MWGWEIKCIYWEIGMDSAGRLLSIGEVSFVGGDDVLFIAYDDSWDAGIFVALIATQPAIHPRL